MTPQDAPRGQFEQRMRLRRAATCVSAARIAIEEGRVLEAQQRLEEACRLDPDSLETRILLEQLRTVEPEEDVPPAAALFEEPLAAGARRWSHWVAVLIAVAALTALALWRGPAQPENQMAPASPPQPRTEPRLEAPAMVQLRPTGEAIAPGTTAESRPEEAAGTLDASPSGAPISPRPEQGTTGRATSPVATNVTTGVESEALSPRPTAAGGAARESLVEGNPRPAPPALTEPAAAVPGLNDGPPATDRAAAPTSVPASPPPPEPAPASDATPASLRDAAAAEEAIGEVLERYVDAYNRLDARAARQVWPAVDERALARAFAGLESQGLTFEACDLAVDGDQATARCRGRARFVPRVGDRDAISQPRRWTFRLREGTAGWHIVQAEAR